MRRKSSRLQSIPRTGSRGLFPGLAGMQWRSSRMAYSRLRRTIPCRSSLLQDMRRSDTPRAWVGLDNCASAMPISIQGKRYQCAAQRTPSSTRNCGGGVLQQMPGSESQMCGGRKPDTAQIVEPAKANSGNSAIRIWRTIPKAHTSLAARPATTPANGVEHWPRFMGQPVKQGEKASQDIPRNSTCNGSTMATALVMESGNGVGAGCLLCQNNRLSTPSPLVATGAVLFLSRSGVGERGGVRLVALRNQPHLHPVPLGCCGLESARSDVIRPAPTLQTACLQAPVRNRCAR